MSRPSHRPDTNNPRPGPMSYETRNNKCYLHSRTRGRNPSRAHVELGNTCNRVRGAISMERFRYRLESSRALRRNFIRYT